jgi:hypothetical protein
MPFLSWHSPTQSSPRKCIERQSPECAFDSPEWDLLSTVAGADGIMRELMTYCERGHTIGSNTALLPEASDAAISGATVADGESGDTDFPFMDMKTLLTAGERSVCPESYGYKLTGVPDGMGAMLLDDETVRVMYQSESYGPIRFESFPAAMNDGAFTMGGSRVQYVVSCVVVNALFAFSFHFFSSASAVCFFAGLRPRNDGRLHEG